MFLRHRRQLVDDLADESRPDALGERFVEGGSHHHVVKRGMARARGVDAEDEHRAGYRGGMRRSAMDGEGRPTRDVALLRELADGLLGIVRPGFLRWEHLVRPEPTVVPLR